MDCYFLFNCNELTVFYRFSFSHSLLFVSFFSSGLVILVLQSAFTFLFIISFKISACVTNSSLPAHYTLKNRVLAHQLHCSGIRLVTGSNTCGFLTCFFWMCEVNNTGSATTRIMLSETLFGVATLPTGPYCPGGFSTAEE